MMFMESLCLERPQEGVEKDLWPQGDPGERRAPGAEDLGNGTGFISEMHRISYHGIHWMHVFILFYTMLYYFILFYTYNL